MRGLPAVIVGFAEPAERRRCSGEDVVCAARAVGDAAAASACFAFFHSCHSIVRCSTGRPSVRKQAARCEICAPSGKVSRSSNVPDGDAHRSRQRLLDQRDVGGYHANAAPHLGGKCAVVHLGVQQLPLSLHSLPLELRLLFQRPSVQTLATLSG